MFLNCKRPFPGLSSVIVVEVLLIVLFFLRFAPASPPTIPPMPGAIALPSKAPPIVLPALPCWVVLPFVVVFCVIVEPSNSKFSKSNNSGFSEYKPK